MYGMAFGKKVGPPPTTTPKFGRGVPGGVKPSGAKPGKPPTAGGKGSGPTQHPSLEALVKNAHGKPPAGGKNDKVAMWLQKTGKKDAPAGPKKSSDRLINPKGGPKTTVRSSERLQGPTQLSKFLGSPKGPGVGGAHLDRKKSNTTTPKKRVRDPLMTALMKGKTMKDAWAEKARASSDAAKAAAAANLLTPGIAGVRGGTSHIANQQKPRASEGNVFVHTVGDSTEESLERVKRRHRSKRRVPKTLTESEILLIEEELRRRRKAAEMVERKDDKSQLNRLLGLSDKDLIDTMLLLREDRMLRDLREGKTPRGRHRLTEDAEPAPKNAPVQSPTGTQFLPAVWSLPHGKIKPPGVHVDENLLRADTPMHPARAPTALLGTGPFGVGEAKACLDDLQAHLLNYYGTLFQIEPNLPLEWQMEQLARSYYPDLGHDKAPSPALKPLPLEDAAAKAAAAKALDSSKTKFPSPPPALPKEGEDSQKKARKADKEGEPKDDEPKDVYPVPDSAVERDASLPAVKRDIGGVMSELYDLTRGNEDKLTHMLNELHREIGDPIKRTFWRSKDMRATALTAPSYMGAPPYKEYLGELEEDVETMYRNLRTTTEWNARRIRLMEDRLKVFKQCKDKRIGL